MIVEVDAASPVPPFEQLRAQIAEMIASGVIADGGRLPTIRQLARDLGIAEGTVARTYRELERDGWIETRRRHGSFARRPETARPAELERALAEAAAAFALRVAQTGADPAHALEVVDRALRTLSPRT